MEQSVYALTEYESFIRELLDQYKQYPVLWQQKHPNYRNKRERSKAYADLVKRAQEYVLEADEDFVRMKIDSMRTCFRKERKKVLFSKQNSSSPGEIYKPSLWYYDLLLFIAGEEAETETNIKGIKCEDVGVPEHGNSVKIPFWNREHSAILINLYKNHPCLYSTSHPFYRIKWRRIEAIKKVTAKLMATTGKFFHTGDVRRKLSLIRGQFLHEYKKIRNCESRGEKYTPTLWCFEMLSFLKNEYVNPRKAVMIRESSINLRRKPRRDPSTSQESEDDIDIKQESDASLSSESVHLESKDGFQEDVYDTIATNLAHNLRDMTEKQRLIANRIIRDVMYHGQMEHLMENSKLVIDHS